MSARAPILPSLLVVTSLLACSGSAAAPGPHEQTRPWGSLTVALRTEANGLVYRLRDATFELSGRGHLVLETESDADAPALRHTLPVGDYHMLLVDGWRLERSSDAGGVFVTVPAQLASPNPRDFTIVGGRTTPVDLRFRIPGTGDLDLSIEVLDETVPDAGAS